MPITTQCCCWNGVCPAWPVAGTWPTNATVRQYGFDFTGYVWDIPTALTNPLCVSAGGVDETTNAATPTGNIIVGPFGPFPDALCRYRIGSVASAWLPKSNGKTINLTQSSLLFRTSAGVCFKWTISLAFVQNIFPHPLLGVNYISRASVSDPLQCLFDWSSDTCGGETAAYVPPTLTGVIVP